MQSTSEDSTSQWCRASVIATGTNRTRQSEDGRWKKRLDVSNVSSASPNRLEQNASTVFPVPPGNCQTEWHCDSHSIEHSNPIPVGSNIGCAGPNIFDRLEKTCLANADGLFGVFRRHAVETIQNGHPAQKRRSCLEMGICLRSLYWSCVAGDTEV